MIKIVTEVFYPTDGEISSREKIHLKKSSCWGNKDKKKAVESFINQSLKNLRSIK